MERILKNSLCFALGFLLIAFVEFGYADATPTSSWTATNQTYTGYGATANAACSAAFAQIPSTSSPKLYGWTYYSPPQTTDHTDKANTATCRTKCTNSSKCGASYNVVGPSGSAAETLTCPTGTSLQGRSCVPVSNCTLPVGSVLSSGYYDIGTSPSGAPPTTICSSSCTGIFNGTSPAKTGLVNGVTHYYAQGSYETADQVECSPDTPAGEVSAVGSSVPSPTCAAGQSVGWINNTPVCYIPVPDSNPTQPSVTTTQTKTTTTNDQNEPVETTTTTNPDGSVTTTTVVTHPNGNQTVEKTETPTSPENLKTFCESNPNSTICREQRSECEKNPDTVGCMKPGDIPAAESLEQVNIAASFAPVLFATAEGCPAPIEYQIMGSTYFISWEPACDFFATVKPIIIMIAFATSAIILMGVFA